MMAVFGLEAVLSLSKKAFDDGLKESGNSMKSFGQKLGKAAGTAVKITTAAVAAASTAVGAIVKQSIQAYGEFEQLVGGSQLMYGDAFDSVMERAQNAYKTVQMSQSDYLKQVNGFATGLKRSLGGNEQAAADLADRVVTAEADIVAATGVGAEAVQNAFNGIMRGNYTMLDNLQLGIAGTRQGLQQVITDVNAWNRANGRATEYNIQNTADIMNALVDYVEMQGLAGYAANKASSTIQGSIAQMKSAYKNLLVGLADPTADINSLISNFVDSVQTVGDNIAPHIESILEGIGTLISKASETIVPKITDYISANAGSMISAGVELIVNLISGLLAATPDIIKQIPGIIESLKNAFIENKDALKEAGEELIGMVALAISNGLGFAVGVGAQIVSDIWSGIESKWGELETWFQGIFDKLFGGLSANINIGASYDGGWQPGMAVGMDYVPYNDYHARLHRGEAVLTRSEAEAWRRGQGSGSGVVINQYMQEVVKTPVEHASATLSYFEQARWAM